MQKINILILLSILFILSGCQSTEDKILKIVNDDMYNSLHDYHSYEVIRTDIFENSTSMQDYLSCIKLAKQHISNMELLDNNSTALLSEFLKRKNNISIQIYPIYSNLVNNKSKNTTNEIQYYSVTQKFRCKDRNGNYGVHKYTYIIDKEVKHIMEEYKVEDYDSKKNIDSIIVDLSSIGKYNLEWKTKNEDYLRNNLSNPKVKSTASGLQYIILKQGTGRTPKWTDKVKTLSSGCCIDGSGFDSTYERKSPSESLVSEKIEGIAEALMMMPVGSEWRIFIPSQLGSGAAGNYNSKFIKPYSVYIADIKLIDIIN